MTNSTPLPVSNLRKIWDQKKSEMQFTQVEAAHDLQWSQGAISHYLTGLTHLGAPAAIKFANFLGVDPTEIDPDIEESLPCVSKIDISYNSNDMSQPLKGIKIYSKKRSISTYIQLDDEAKLEFCNVHAEGSTVVQVCNIEDHLRSDLYAVRLKRNNNLHFFKKNELPENNKIIKIWAVVAFHTYY